MNKARFLLLLSALLILVAIRFSVRASDPILGTWSGELNYTYGVASSPAVDHGLVFFGGLDGTFYAFRQGG